MKKILAGLMGLMLATTSVTALAVAPSYELDAGRNRFYANGNAIILAEGTTAGNTVVYLDADRDGVVDAGEGMVEITTATGSYDAAGYDLSDFSIFGGSDTDLTADTQITMTGGTVGLIYGANFNSDLTGDVVVNVQGGEVLNQVYGGGAGCDVVGDVSMTFGADASIKWVAYAGGAASSTTKGNVSIDVDTGAEVGAVFAGGNKSMVTSTKAPVVIGDDSIVNKTSQITIEQDVEGVIEDEMRFENAWDDSYFDWQSGLSTEITTDKANSGNSSLQVNLPANGGYSLDKTLQQSIDGKVVTVWFYDDMTDDANYTNRVTVADKNFGQANLGVSTHVGIHTATSLTNYTVDQRGGTGTQETTVARSEGWHRLQWDYTTAGEVNVYIDGTEVYTAPITGDMGKGFNMISMWGDGTGVAYTAFLDDITISTSLDTYIESDTTQPTETPEPTETPDPSLPPVVDGGTIIVEEEEAKAGEEVMVDIVLEDNPGLAAMKLTVDYDGTALEFVDVVYNSEFSGNTFDPVVDEVNSKFNLNWVQLTEVTTEDITYATVTFKVLDDAAEGVYDIDVTYDSGNVINAQEQEVTFAIDNGFVEVVDILMGDVNEDGVINNKDVFGLLTYLSDNTYVIEARAGDMDGNGIINNADVMALFMYVSKEI